MSAHFEFGSQAPPGEPIPPGSARKGLFTDLSSTRNECHAMLSALRHRLRDWHARAEPGNEMCIFGT